MAIKDYEKYHEQSANRGPAPSPGPPGPPPTGKSRVLVSMIAAALLLVGGLVAFMAAGNSEEEELLQATLERAKSELRKAEIVKKDLERPDRDIAKRWEEIGGIVPEELDTKAFLETSKKLARENDIRIGEESVQEKTTPLYSKADVFLFIEGEPEALDKFIQALKSDEQFVRVREINKDMSPAKLSLTLYAVPSEDKSCEQTASKCTVPAGRDSLLPPSKKVEALREEITRICAMLDRLSEANVKICEYRKERSRQEAAKKIIESDG